MADVHQPLLPSDHHIRDVRHATASYASTARHQTKRYLTSKTGHYSVLLLVSLDISAIFADLLIQLLTCEGRVSGKDGEEVSEVLDIVSLVFSSLFMASRGVFNCNAAIVLTSTA